MAKTSNSSGMWIVPHNLSSSPWFSNTKTLQDHTQQIHAIAKNCMYQAKFRNVSSWTHRRRAGRVSLQERSWFTYLMYRIVADAPTFSEAYANRIPTKQKRGEFNPAINSYVHFEGLTHKAFRHWVEKSQQLRKRKREATAKAQKSKRNEVELFISSSDHGKVECSFTIRFDADMFHQRNWNLLDSGTIVLSEVFEKVRISTQTDKRRYKTPLARTPATVSPSEARKLRAAEYVGFEQLHHNIFQQDFPEDSDPKYFRLNTRWVETLMGLPINTVNPSADNLTVTYSFASQVANWRNNG